MEGTFKFETYDESIITRKDGSTGKKGFTTIPLEDKWELLTIAQKVAVLKSTDRISQNNVPELEQVSIRDKMDAFASLYGFKGNAQVGNKGFVYCNRRPDSSVSFASVLDDPDSSDILAQLGFGSR